MNMSLWDSLKTGGPGAGRAEWGGKRGGPCSLDGGRAGWGVRVSRCGPARGDRARPGRGAGWREPRGAHGAARGTGGQGEEELTL